MEHRTIKDKLSQQYVVKTNLSTYKELHIEDRIIKAVANTYNYFDSDFDVLRMGCCAKSIEDRGFKSKAPDKILHALFHDLRRLPGKSIFEAETEVDGHKVLYVESHLSETNDGEDTLIKYKDDIYNQHSIGFRYQQIEFIEKESPEWEKFISNLINPEDAEKVGFGYDVTEIKWHEWSTVAFGANKLTPFLGIKTKNKGIALQNIYTKIDALIRKANRCEVKNKFIFDLQLSQMKQMISELVYQKPSLKDTLIIEPSASDTLDYGSLMSRL
ncbi:MAG: hypothetical protein ACUZ8H_01450 [Candidatus Anammoxibacter sp.]